MRSSTKFILLFLIFASIGCAAVSKWTDAQSICASDPACLEKTKGYAKIGEAVASPFGPIAAGGAGAVITYIALGVLGLRKKKDDEKK